MKNVHLGGSLEAGRISHRFNGPQVGTRFSSTVFGAVDSGATAFTVGLRLGEGGNHTLYLGSGSLIWYITWRQVMTVSLIVLEPKEIQVPPLLIPVATQDMYTRVWLRGAAAIGAFWLPMFETGVDVSGEDFPEVQAELALLQNWVASASIDSGERAHMLIRIDQLIDGLIKLSSETEGTLTVFIG